jgi:hypothetical protein
MGDNPYRSPEAAYCGRFPGVSRRWKYRFILPISASVIVSSIDASAVMGGFSLQITEPSRFETFVFYLNFVGVFVAFVFGDLLAHPDDPVHQWNLFLFCAGGAASWALLSWIIGYCLDKVRLH